jgi:hypothetical protein
MTICDKCKQPGAKPVQVPTDEDDSHWHPSVKRSYRDLGRFDLCDSCWSLFYAYVARFFDVQPS